MDLKLAILDIEKNKIKEFLLKYELSFDEDIDWTVYLEEDSLIIGTISTSKNIIKAFAVSENYKGQIASLLISEAINHIFQTGFDFYQVYTKPEYINMFENLSFYEIISSSKVALLESRNRNIVNTLKGIYEKENLKSNDTGCIVMNCNPFTLGHRYIIEKAAKNHDLLIVFILEEDRSFFMFKDRFEMVVRGVSDLENVRVIPSSNYLISALTFPTYFLKKEDSKIYEQALLDAMIFEKYFIPIFNLKKRYLGSEEDIVTRKYNEVLKNKLGEFIEIIPRLKYDDKFISASIVRRALDAKKFEEISHYVPKTTYDYLVKHYG